MARTYIPRSCREPHRPQGLLTGRSFIEPRERERSKSAQKNVTHSPPSSLTRPLPPPRNRSLSPKSPVFGTSSAISIDFAGMGGTKTTAGGAFTQKRTTRRRQLSATSAPPQCHPSAASAAPQCYRRGVPITAHQTPPGGWSAVPSSPYPPCTPTRGSERTSH